MKAEFIYDSSKRMWYKHASRCCGAVLEQKMLFQGKPVKEGFKLQTSTKAPVKETVKRKWYQLWRPKYQEVIIRTETEVSYKKVQFRYYCTECGKQDSGLWDFKHKGVSEGQLALSKSVGVGSTPATPAIEKELE